MKAYAIVVKGNVVSENGYADLVKSSQDVSNDFNVERFDAVPTNEVNRRIIEHKLVWNYPWIGNVIDIATGLLKSTYPTANKLARISCSLSHYELWLKCALGDEQILILEHDAHFNKKLDTTFSESKYDIIGINHPHGATRRARVFLAQIDQTDAGSEVQIVPTVDDANIPQGIAGNSAYIIKPNGAKHLIKLCAEYGLWPNDAIMCKQLVKKLGVSKTFYTGVQGLPSTTSL